MGKKDSIFIEGLPLEAKWKRRMVLIFIILAAVNHILPTFIESLNYAYKDYVSLGLLIFFVLFSIGSILSEGLVIAVCLFAIGSNLWDLTVYDITVFRKNIFLGSFVILSIALIFGKISVWNLASKIKSLYEGD